MKINIFSALNPFKKPIVNTSRLFGSIATADKYSRIQDKIDNPNTDSSKLPSTLEKFQFFLLDPHLSSCVQSRKSGVLSMNWEIVSNNNNDVVVKMLNSIFSYLDTRKIISQILDAPLYGYQPIEIYWDYDNEYLIPKDLVGKPAWWFHFDGHRLCYYSNDSVDRIYLPKNKFIVAQHNDTYSNPYGESVLSKCYMPLIFKRGGFELWSLFIQKYGMPWIWGKVLSGNDNDISEALAAIAALKQDGAIAAGENMELSLLDGSSSGSSDNYLSFIHFCNAEISKAILSQTLTTEQGTTGSYAMSQTHLTVRKDVVESDAKIVESVMNRLIEFIVELNFNDVAELPKFVLYGDLEADITLARRDQIIFSTGYVKPTKAYLTRNHNYKDDEIEMIDKPQSQSAFSEGNEDIDELDKYSKQVINSIVAMIKKGKAYSEIEDLLVTMLPELNTNEIEQYFSQAIIVAQASGMIDGAK
jgi:phage gp29-like protein